MICLVRKEKEDSSEFGGGNRSAVGSSFKISNMLLTYFVDGCCMREPGEKIVDLGSVSLYPRL